MGGSSRTLMATGRGLATSQFVSSSTELKVAATPPPNVSLLTFALSVGPQNTLLNPILCNHFLPIVTPLRWEKWEELLAEAGVLDLFRDVVVGIRDSFHLGISSSILSTFLPLNHKSALDNSDIITAHIEKEHAAGRYSDPYDLDLFEQLFGPFRSSPLGVVFNPNSGKSHLIQDHSFPCNNPNLLSINSEIDSSDFQCDWGTFANCFLLVAKAPPGTQAAVFDVDAAHRHMPIAPEDRFHVTIFWDGKVRIDHAACFGASSSSGIFGRAADGFVAILKFKSIEDIIKWADDFVFFRYPSLTFPDGSFGYRYDASIIWSTAEYVGWPWSVPKFLDFAFEFPYIGFNWDIPQKTVQLPQQKKVKYLARLASWSKGVSVLKHDIEVVIGTLNHCAIIIPTSRTHLPSLYHLSSHFPANAHRLCTRLISGEVLADIVWWHHQLSLPFCGMGIYTPGPPSSTPLFVDVSTSWGIGLIFGDNWSAWRLSEGWKSDGRDIGWAEMVAVELAVHSLIAAGQHHSHFLLHSDNQGVVGALKAGVSRSSQQNSVLHRIVSLLLEHSLWLTTIWVASKDNPADAPSRGILPSPSSRLVHTVPIPGPLCPFLITT